MLPQLLLVLGQLSFKKKKKKKKVFSFKTVRMINYNVDYRSILNSFHIKS